jgi:amino acid adenylation domain-containing protein
MMDKSSDPGERTGLEVAVVGMAGRFPGADDIHAFWRNLREGVESVSFFTREQLLADGADPAVVDRPDFVPAKGELRGADELDAALFNLTPRDASVLDPQHRVLLECAWSALEHAGYDPARVEGNVGVFAGSSGSTYARGLAATPEVVNAVGLDRISLWNDKDQLAGGISYRMNLRGPSLSVQTACSSSLVAVHLACQSLLNCECDIALAGGVSVQVPLRRGYVYAPDGVLSPDGHCRAFDAAARGTVSGNGAGLVALKRLDDALADGDTIHAVIRGSAINNDGAQKIGYTAPSVAGQARVLSEAMSVAGVDASTVQYVETHGTGTPLGDAIELKAMSQVFSRAGDGHRCAIGSVKSNMGHLDAAAGIAGLLKTVLAISHAEMPPSLNCTVPHPEIEAAGGRVFVNTALRPWERNGTPRRAGVSSFGLGGTNAHLVLEEAPAADESGRSRAEQLLVLSARTPTALADAAGTLADWIERESPALADAAFTLQAGRRELEHRLAVSCADAAEAAARLREAAGRAPAAVPRADRPVAFMFPGLGLHHVDMGRGLYDAEPVFRDAVDECCALLRPVLGSDLREVLFARGEADGEAKRGGGWDLRRMLGRAPAAEEGGLDDTRFAQPAVFVVEYALARLWDSWGVRPRALMGHSLGEYVAACVAGVLRLEDALRLVGTRAKLIDALPAGAMLAVPLGEATLREILPAELDLAAVNTAESCVVSGPGEAVAAFEAVLAERGTVSRRLPTRHAFHSRAMAPVAAELERLVAGFTLRAPEIPFVSNVTGTWITDDEACSPAYWARHLCQAVRFADGVATLRQEPGWVLLEVGPGQTLGAWALQHPAAGGAEGRVVLSSLPHQHNRVPDLRFVLETLGGLWAAGVAVDWAAFSRGERRRRVPLPGYAYERKRYWVDPPRAAPPVAEPQGIQAPRIDPRVADTDAHAGATDAPAPHQQGPESMDNRIAARDETATAQSPRYVAVLGRLRALAAELTGMEEHHVVIDVDFFQAGIDSLLLLQVIQQVEKRFGVRISLVELLEEIATVDSLARYIDHVLPADAVVEGVPPVELMDADPPAAASNGAPAPSASDASPATNGSHVPSNGNHAPMSNDSAQNGHHAPSRIVTPPMFTAPAAYAAPAPAAGESAVERVIAQQLQLMSQQLATLRGESVGPVHAPAAATSVETQPAAPQIASVSASTVIAPSSAAVAPVAGAACALPAAPAAEAAATVVAVVPRQVEQAPRAKIQPPTFVAYQPLNTEGAGGMTARQREYLDGFMARYAERTKASKAHQARYHVPLADGRVTARFRRAWKEITYPIVGQRALGSRVWDVDGNEYVDTGMAFGCNLFGHAPEFVSAAIRGQVEAGYGVGPQSADAGRAAELVCELGGNERAVFCNSGTEAVMGAVRAARAYTGRTKVAIFAGSYHGWSDIVLGRMMPDGEVRPSAPGVPALPLGDVLMLDFDEPASLERLARHIHEIALVMVEPVQSRRPDLQPFAFLRELRRMTTEAGALLLFDELITGFRMGPGGAQAFFGVQADLVTYGKIVAGGLPMGVVAGTREAMSVFDGGVWQFGDDSFPPAQRTLFAGAYFKHPLSMAVAYSILDEIRRRGQPMYDELEARTARLVERMNAFFDEGGYPITAAYFSSCFRFFFGAEIKFADLFSHHMVMEGIHVIPETGTHFLSTAHTDADLELVFQGVCAAAEKMRAGGFIPGPAGGATTSIAGSASAAPALASSASNGSSASTASSVSTALDVSPATATAEARADGIREVPLTEGQRQLWIESQMGDEAALAYIESSSIRLHGPMDADALHRALQALVDRHDTLRVTFAPAGDVQLVHPAWTVELPRADFRGVAPDAREARLEAWVRGIVRRPFDLERGPLARFALAALADDEHVLVFDTHHAALDGWSFGVLIQELGALYAAAKEGRAAALPPAPRLAESVGAQVAALQEDPAAEAYWLAQFADGVPVLDLPADRPRPAVRSYAGERMVRVMDAGLMRRLADAGRPHGISLFHVYLAAFYVWLSRLSGADDLVVGVPSAGQAAGDGGAELVGYGINVLPLRARVDASATFAEHARAVRRGVMYAVQHQSFSFPRLVEKLLRTRDASRPPLFSVLLNVDRAPGHTLLGDLRAEFGDNFGGGSKLDLNFTLTEDAHELRLSCDYSTALFDAETMERWLGAYERLLQQVADDAQTPLAALELLDAAERRQVVHGWNPAADFPVAECIHQRFQAQAHRTPDAVALSAGDERLTYAELDERANRLAHHLRGRGVGPESRVALCLERGAEMIVAILGVLKAGGAYVPLDPAHPAERLAYTVADAGVALVLTHDAAREALPAVPGVEVLRLDADAARIAAEPADDPEVAVSPENLAYVIYTSGSTGTPKGTLIGHAAVARLFDATDGWFGFGAQDVWTLFHSYAFDFSVWEIWGALLYGGRLVVVPREVTRDPARFRALLAAERVTVLSQTPSAFRALCRADEDAAEPLEHLRTVVFGGEALQYESLRGWLDRYGPRRPRLVNMYGITETTVHVTYHAVTGAELRQDGAASGVGVPIPDLRTYVLDRAGQPCPVGVPGELHVGGAGLARGYLGRAALTAQRFVPDALSGLVGARLYRSGDLARWKADGTLEYLGRMDQQVKIRGFRIELGEIESVLLAQPGVAAAAVIVRGDGEDATLAAYVVPAGEAPSAAVLRAALAKQLPEYMVPAAFVPIDRIPLTTNGKLDRAALPAPQAAGPTAGSSAAPRTPVEEVLAGIWAQVLRRDSIGVDEHFFEIGGHSLLATRVVSRVREVFGVEMPLRALFEAPTVATLAARVDAERAAERPRLPAVVPVERTDALPLSFAQERLWFLERLQPGTAVYTCPLPLRLRGALDVPALERALGETVRRHESLRTVFAETDDGPVQRITPFAGFALPVETVDAADGEAEVARHVADEAGRPFDLCAGPLFRAQLLRLADDDHALLLCMHHVVTDGWSTGVLLREVAALYAAFREGRESPLAEPPVQYADFAAWQRTHLQGGQMDAQLAWWTERLAGAPALLELPTDRPRPAVQSHRGAWAPVELPAALVERLQALARGEGATLYMVLLAAFQVLLGKYAASDDVVVGTPIAGRTRAETEGLIGFFVNTLVLRTDLSGDPAFREVLRRVRETTLGAYEHQDAPFERLVEALRPERTLDHAPLFQAMLELHNTDGGAAEFAGLAIEGIAEGVDTSKFDLSLALAATERGLSGGLTYAADLFDPSTARRMMEHLARVLEQAAADADVRLSALRLMDDGERARVVDEWNRTDAEYPADTTIHALFQAQAAQTPDAAALACGDASLTYRELDERANRLAHHLAALGVGPEVRVGLLLERGVDLVVALLGVLKAGGAYVPMDPGHPAERLAYLLDDSRVPVLLTQQALRGRVDVPAGVRVVEIDAEWGRIEAHPHTPPAERATAENLAYVIYTSGSTGRPKGVAMHHRGVCNYIAFGVAAYGADEGHGAPLFTSMAVDLTVTNLLPLFAGRRVLLLPEESPVEALAEVLRGGPDFGLIKITPVHLGLLTPMLTPEQARTAARTLVIGGDNLAAETSRFWQEHAPDVRLINEYGPTETVVGCSAYLLPTGLHQAGSVPVGRAIQNLRFYVLDAHGQPVPAGLPGELYVGGAGVARGYLGRPALSAEKFVPDPFAGAGARMYRTGDRALWQGDGNLRVLGRTDHQVKVRGYRVELGEIEAELRRLPEVRECLVTVRTDRPGDPRLVAYVVGGTTAEALRTALLRSLPEYMVPSAFVLLPALPQTATGKLDPRSLPAPDYARPGAEFDEPRNYEEAQLIPMWEELLGARGIGATQSFFDLGGSSLLALRLFTQVNRRFGCDLPVATLFAGATVRHMADAIRAQRAEGGAAPASVVPLQPHGTLPPIFFIHSADRNVMGYVNVVRYLGADQPAFGVRDVGEDMARPVPQIAAEHVAAIRAVRPHGPYYLASWSFGGIVAFEMGRQLQAAGETVAFVGMLDTLAPELMQAWSWEKDEDVVIVLAREVAEWMRRPFHLRPEDLAGLPLEEQVRRAVDALRAEGAAPENFDEAALLEQCRMVRDRMISYTGYAPGRFDGTLTLFRATECTDEYEAFFASRGKSRHALGWSPLATEPVEVHVVPGTHASLGAEPHVRVLADRLRDSLAAARLRAESAAGRAAGDSGMDEVSMDALPADDLSVDADSDADAGLLAAGVIA